MGVLTDMRSAARDSAGLGGDAIVFWLMAGLGAGRALRAWIGAGAKKAFALIGVAIGLYVGFYAACGATRMARALAPAGVLILGIQLLAGM
jgi:hypothetical protein